MHSHHVMVIDDEPHILNILKINLEGAGYTVTEFNSVVQARAALSALQPQLIISDHEMPGGGHGLDLLRHVRAQAASPAPEIYPFTPFILLTGSTLLHMQLKPELETIPNLELHSKPFSIRNLLKTVKAMLDASEVSNLSAATTLQG